MYLEEDKSRRAYDIAFLGYLLFTTRECMPILAEHLTDQNGEILPYILMGELTNWLALRESNSRDDPIVNRIIGMLEESFNEYDSQIDNLIAAGFVENLPGPEETGASLRNKLGPKLKGVLSNIWFTE